MKAPSQLQHSKKDSKATMTQISCHRPRTTLETKSSKDGFAQTANLALLRRPSESETIQLRDESLLMWLKIT